MSQDKLVDLDYIVADSGVTVRDVLEKVCADRVGTHWDGCERVHPVCAAFRLYQAEKARRERAEDEISVSRKCPYCAHAEHEFMPGAAGVCACGCSGGH